MNVVKNTKGTHIASKGDNDGMNGNVGDGIRIPPAAISIWPDIEGWIRGDSDGGIMGLWFVYPDGWDRSA